MVTCYFQNVYTNNIEMNDQVQSSCITIEHNQPHVAHSGLPTSMKDSWMDGAHHHAQHMSSASLYDHKKKKGPQNIWLA